MDSVKAQKVTNEQSRLAFFLTHHLTASNAFQMSFFVELSEIQTISYDLASENMLSIRSGISGEDHEYI